jgi:hypothetical protein
MVRLKRPCAHRSGWLVCRRLVEVPPRSAHAGFPACGRSKFTDRHRPARAPNPEKLPISGHMAAFEVARKVDAGEL